MPQAFASGASPGTPGGNGSPGAPGTFGRGGRNRLFWYHRQGGGDPDTKKQYVEESGAAEVLRRYGVTAAQRAADGARSEPFGVVPPPPEPASAGSDGKIVCARWTAAEMGALCEASYFDDMQRWAEQDTACGTEWVERGIETGEPDTWMAGQGLLGRAQLGYMWLGALAHDARPDLLRKAQEQLAAIARFVRAHPFAPATVP